MLRVWLARILIVALVVCAVVLGVKACAPQPEVAAPPPAPRAFALTSPAFAHGGAIPAHFTADGRDISPPLAWRNVPPGTSSFALTMEDPDAPVGTFTHWLVADIPGHVSAIPAGLPARGTVDRPFSAAQGSNDFRRVGYGGPAPPPGKPHRYVFTLRALEGRLDLSPEFSERHFRAALSEARVLDEAVLIGTYERPEE